MTLDDLLNRHGDRIIFTCIAGSHAYGTASVESDQDLRGIYVVPSKEYLSLNLPEDHVRDDRGDTVYYTLRRFFELATDANPNLIELLFVPENCVQVRTAVAERLLALRHLFISKRCVASHIGYAQAQIKKARGKV